MNHFFLPHIPSYVQHIALYFLHISSYSFIFPTFPVILLCIFFICLHHFLRGAVIFPSSRLYQVLRPTYKGEIFLSYTLHTFSYFPHVSSYFLLISPYFLLISSNFPRIFLQIYFLFLHNSYIFHNICD